MTIDYLLQSDRKPLQSLPDVRMVTAGLTMVKVASSCVLCWEGQGFTSKYEVFLRVLCWLISWTFVEAGGGGGVQGSTFKCPVKEGFF